MPSDTLARAAIQSLLDIIRSATSRPPAEDEFETCFVPDTASVVTYRI